MRRRKQNPISTIGHSTRSIEDFIRLLQAYGVTSVADVRTIPRSHHNPQFNADELPQRLKKAGIGYLHLKDLGGLRHTKKDSPNTGWRNVSFRGYADYMQTREFTASLKELIDLTKKERLAIMCAEAVPWRCHRSLIADALTVRGIPVMHIMNLNHATPHKLTPFAHVEGKKITYPAEKLQQAA